MEAPLPELHIHPFYFVYPERTLSRRLRNVALNWATMHQIMLCSRRGGEWFGVLGSFPISYPLYQVLLSCEFEACPQGSLWESATCKVAQGSTLIRFDASLLPSEILNNSTHFIL